MTLPQTMKAVEISTPGGPDVLKPCERPVPQPAKGEILIKVTAAGVNGPDIIAQGLVSRTARRLRLARPRSIG